MLAQVAVDTLAGSWQADLYASPDCPDERPGEDRDGRLQAWLYFAICFQAHRHGGVFLATLPSTDD